ADQHSGDVLLQRFWYSPGTPTDDRRSCSGGLEKHNSETFDISPVDAIRVDENVGGSVILWKLGFRHSADERHAITDPAVRCESFQASALVSLTNNQVPPAWQGASSGGQRFEREVVTFAPLQASHCDEKHLAAAGVAFANVAACARSRE